MSSAAKPSPFSRTHLLGRIAAAVLGGYAFCWGFIVLDLAVMYAAGMSFHDAEHLSAILGLLLFLAVFCWAFIARSLPRVWLVLLGGAAVMAGAGELVKRAVLATAGGL